MKVTYKDNVLKVITDISKATYDKGVADLVAKDEKGNHLYRIGFNAYGDAGIDNASLTCNAVVDGKLAVVIVMPAGMKLEDVQKNIGANLVNAKKYSEVIAAQAEASVAAIEAIFEEGTDTEEAVQ